MPFAVLLVAVLFTLFAIRNRVRASRGIFILYLWVSAFIPYLLANAFGLHMWDYVFWLVSPEADLAALLCLILLACVSMYPLRLDNSARPSVVLFRSQRTASKLAALSIVLAILFLLVVAVAAGTLKDAILAFSLRSVINNSAINYAFVLAVFSSTLCIFSFRFASFRGHPLIIVCIVLNAYILFVSGGRSVLILFFVGMIFADLIKMTAARFAASMLPGLLAVASISYVMVDSRLQAQDAQVLASNRSFAEFAFAGLTSIDDIALAVRYVESHGHHPREIYGPVLSLPVPRQIWPDKPIQFSRLFRQYRYGDASAGLPPGILGESYIAGGLLWVICISLIYAWVLFKVDRLALIGNVFDDPSRQAIAGVLGPTIAFALYRGGLDLGAIRVLIPLLGCVLAWLIVKSSGRRPKVLSQRSRMLVGAD